MPLPKMMTAKYSLTLPSSGKVVKYRPFLVKEEKVLLMALESKDEQAMIQSIKDVVDACVDDVEVFKLPYFDLEYLFLNLRAKSVGEEVKYLYRHKGGINRAGEKCEASTEVAVRLDLVQVTKPENHSMKFSIDDKYGVKLRYPTIDDVSKVSKLGKNFAVEVALLAACIECVYDDEEVYTPESTEEAIAFIENLSSAQYAKFVEFFQTMPKLEHTVTYACSGCGQVDEVKFSGVSDFF